MAPNTGYIEIDLECDFVRVISRKLKLEHLKAKLHDLPIINVCEEYVQVIICVQLM